MLSVRRCARSHRTRAARSLALRGTPRPRSRLPEGSRRLRLGRRNPPRSALRALLLWEQDDGYRVAPDALLISSRRSIVRAGFPGTLRRILVIKTDHIGDFLLCLPAVRDFAASEPGARVGVVVGSWNRAIASAFPGSRSARPCSGGWSARRRGERCPESTLDKILLGMELVINAPTNPAAAIAAIGGQSRAGTREACVSRQSCAPGGRASRRTRPRPRRAHRVSRARSSHPRSDRAGAALASPDADVGAAGPR